MPTVDGSFVSSPADTALKTTSRARYASPDEVTTLLAFATLLATADSRSASAAIPEPAIAKAENSDIAMLPSIAEAPTH